MRAFSPLMRRRSALLAAVLAGVAALVVGALLAGHSAGALPPVIDLDSTSADLTVYGDDAYDESGDSLAAGDINGDGTDDLIIGADEGDPAGGTDAGETYVIYGGPSLPSVIDLDSTPADLTVYGDDSGDFSGYAVAAGDINGDTTNDLIIGALGPNPHGNDYAGGTYVIYGDPDLPSAIDLNSTSADLTVYGDDTLDESGCAVAAGDVNGDGTGDLIIGAQFGDGSGTGTSCGAGQVGDRCDAGETYVIYGGGSLPSTIDLSTTNADLTVYGDDPVDISGVSAAAGDISADGTDDLIIGAHAADPAGGSDAGETYVIYGGPEATPTPTPAVTPTPTPTLTPTPTATLTPTPALTLGALLPFQGWLAEYGPVLLNAAQLAADHINDAGGVLGGEVQIVQGDTESDPATGVSEALRLINTEGASVIVGAAASVVSLPVAEQATVPNGVLQISPASTSPALTALADDDLLFRTALSDAAQGKVLAELAWELGYVTASTLYIDDAYGQGLSGAFVDSFRYLGGDVLAAVPHAPGLPSYLAELEEATAGGPDVLVAISYPNAATVYLTEAIQGALIDQFLFVDGTKSEDIIDDVCAVAGAGCLDGTYGTAPAKVDSPAGTAFDTAYELEYGEPPPLYYAREAYDAVILAALAAEAAGSSDPSAIRDELRDISRPGGEAVGLADGGIAYALGQVGLEQEVDYEGASGCVDLDAYGDVACGAIEIWRIESDNIETVRIDPFEPTPGIYVVDSTGDGGDSSPGDLFCDDGSGDCTLRAAIQEANADGISPGAIHFSIGGGGVQTITPGSALPTITQPVTIDGTTQPGYAGAPIIELNGSSAGAGVNGLQISASNSTVRGLAINRFGGNGIAITGPTSGVHIEDNYIGTDVTGSLSVGNGSSGLDVNGYGYHVIQNNVVSGNTLHGMVLRDWNSQVLGNYVGINAAGTASLANNWDGIRVGGHQNAIGPANVLSGNGYNGVGFQGTGAHQNQVQGNFIGTDSTGQEPVGNGSRGVSMTLGASQNTVGGPAPAARNVISGNDGDGLYIIGSGCTDNVVEGNFIGTDVGGSSALGNSGSGVAVDAGPSNTIGLPGAGNVISANAGYGILIINATDNQVQGNFIGIDFTGTVDLGNTLSGVGIVNSASSNTIGGTTPGAGNVISGNGAHGVGIGGGTPTGNQVLGNLIGTDLSGTLALGNGAHGVGLGTGASNNVIGGTATGARNTIAHNSGDGVSVESGTGNAIRGNSIFSNTGLGIDLGPDGVTPNDAGDGDTGANNLQNFPVISLATSGSTAVQGTLNSTPSTQFVLHFSSNTSCDGSGNGEGESFLGSTTVMTNASGNASFTVAFPQTVPPGRFITATATDPGGNTSEFSACIQVASVPIPTPTPTPAPVINRLAGTAGKFDFKGDGGPARDAWLNAPHGSFEVTSSDTLYFADTGNNRVRRIHPNEPTGTITTVAGGGSCTPPNVGDGGPATSACLNNPYDVFVDGPGNLYIADTGNNRIRKVNTAGIISTVAGGGPGCAEPCLATLQALDGPRGVAVDASGNILIADTENHRIRRVDAASGIITTVAGDGTAGFSGDGVPATATHLNRPHDVYMYGRSGDFLIADTMNNRIRRVDGFTGVILTFAGSGLASFGGDGGPAALAHLNGPEAVAVDPTDFRLPNVLIADTQNHRIRRVNGHTSVISTIAGNGTPGSGGDGGDPALAQLNLPAGIAVGSLTGSDTGSSTLRAIDPTTGEPGGKFSGFSCTVGSVSTADWVLVGFVLGLILARRRVRGLILWIRAAAAPAARRGPIG